MPGLGASLRNAGVLAGFHEKAKLVKSAAVAAPPYLKLRRDLASIRTLSERTWRSVHAEVR